MKDFMRPTIEKVSSESWVMGQAGMILIGCAVREEREALAASLRSRGYDVAETEGGEDALLRILQQSPDLALLDADLPGLSGLEVCCAVKKDERTRSVPVILRAPTRQEAGPDEAWRRMTGADAFLSRPYEPRILYWMIDSLLAGGRTRV